jgi:hypothetical protein
MVTQALPAMVALGCAGVAAGPATRAGGGERRWAWRRVGTSGFVMEATGKLMESLAEQGVDTTDAQALGTALADPAMMGEAQTKAALKDLPIAIFDAVSAGLAGRLASKVGTRTLGRFLQAGAKDLVIGAALDAGG